MRPLLAFCLTALLCLTPARAAPAQNILSAATGHASKSSQKISIDLTSPRATLQTFEKLAAKNSDQAWMQAVKCLNLSKAQNQNPIVLAQTLADILSKLNPKPDQLPDAKQVTDFNRHDVVFFPQALFHAWVIDQTKKQPPADITLATNSKGQWVFSADTVSHLNVLWNYLHNVSPKAEIFQTGQIVNVLGPTFAETHWWGWALLAACIFIGLLIGKICSTVLTRLGDNLHEKRRWNARAAVFRNAASPVSLACLTAGIMVGMRFVHMEGDLRSFSVSVLKFLYLLSLGWFLYNVIEVIELALVHFTEQTDSKLDDMMVPLVRKTLRIFVVIVFTLVVAQNVFGLNITGWLAGLGIAGLAVSLAAQDSVKNLFGSLTVFFDKPFMVGDFITFTGYTGTVEEIGFRSTRIRLLSGALVSVPNMKFIDQNVENISARPYIRRQMDVTITYDTPPEKIHEAVEILRDILHDDDVVTQGQFDMASFAPQLAFNELNADSLNIRAFYWYQLNRDPKRGFFTFMEHAQLVNMKLFKQYADAGIDFAFPTQTLYLAGDDRRQLTVNMTQTLPAPADN